MDAELITSNINKIDKTLNLVQPMKIIKPIIFHANYSKTQTHIYNRGLTTLTITATHPPKTQKLGQHLYTIVNNCIRLTIYLNRQQ
jgi:hypothetical protein